MLWCRFVAVSVVATFFAAFDGFAQEGPVSEMPAGEEVAPEEPAPVPMTGPEASPAEPVVTDQPVMPVPPRATSTPTPDANDSGMDPNLAQNVEQDLYSEVLLQGLNKVTARISSLNAPLGTVVRFGTLEIIARACWQAPPEARPENAALMEIWELKAGEQPARIFAGWMFSSSPALSALEHPVYDVTVIRCEKRANPGDSAD